MAKLVTKFKYLKPYGRDGKRNRGGYAKYIATREGVEKIDDSRKHAPATMSQKELIGKILKDFPDSMQMLEYEDYMGQPTIGNASEFITRVLEDNAVDTMEKKTYADYIATRPRAERFGSHGLFTDEGMEVNLSKVSEDLNKHGGNVWTVIISLRREDAERLGYNNGNRWRDMLRTQTEALAANLKIPMETICCIWSINIWMHIWHIPNNWCTKEKQKNMPKSLLRRLLCPELILQALDKMHIFMMLRKECSPQRFFWWRNFVNRKKDILCLCSRLFRN